MLDNFVLGLQALAHSIQVTTTALLYHPAIWGFFLGFITSTGIHAIITSNPRHLYHIITKPAEHCYGLICVPGPEGSVRPFEEFRQQHWLVRVVFYSTTLAFLGIVIIALVKY